MKLRKAILVRIVPLALSIVLWGYLSSRVSYAFPVPDLPGDNLIVNPWFRSASNPSQPGFDGWTQVDTNGVSWGPSQKASNPAPDVIVSGTCQTAEQSCGTAARWAEQAGILYPNIDVFAYQVVKADPAQRKLKFFAYWVSHRVEVGAVNIYGSDSSDGPWTLLWVPLYHSQDVQIVPESRDVVDLWEETGFLERATERGYPYYKIELQARLPEWHMIRGVGFKITGIYFATEFTDIPGVPPPVGSPTVTTADATAESTAPTATELADQGASATAEPHSEPGATDNIEAAEAVIPEPQMTTLTAEPVSATEIALTWNASASNPRGFSLERSLDGVMGWRTIARVKAEDNQYTDNGLAPNTLYYYRLKATQQDISAEALARTLPLAESDPDVAATESELSGAEELGGEDFAEDTMPADSGQPGLAEANEQVATTGSAMQIGILIGFAIAVALFTAVLLLVRQRKQDSG